MTSRSFWSRWRGCALSAAAFAVALAALAPAGASAKDKKTEAAGGGSAKPSIVGTFGDWSVFVGQVGRGKICYAAAVPKSREPSTPKREGGRLYISDRPGEGVRNEVAFIMGFDVAGASSAAAEEKADSKSKTKPKAEPKGKPVAGPVAIVAEETFELVPKGQNLWVKNAARESALIAQMKAGVTLSVKASAAKGGMTTDTYSLDGFSQAMERLNKECPGKG